MQQSILVRVRVRVSTHIIMEVIKYLHNSDRSTPQSLINYGHNYDIEYDGRNISSTRSSPLPLIRNPLGLSKETTPKSNSSSKETTPQNKMKSNRKWWNWWNIREKSEDLIMKSFDPNSIKSNTSNNKLTWWELEEYNQMQMQWQQWWHWWRLNASEMNPQELMWMWVLRGNYANWPPPQPPQSST